MLLKSSLNWIISLSFLFPFVKSLHILSFLEMTSELVKKIPMENESNISFGGTIILLLSLPKNTFLGKDTQSVTSKKTIKYKK